MNNKLLAIDEFQLYERLPNDNREDVENKQQIAIELALLDLQNILGRNLYFTILHNRDNSSYQELLIGSEFEYQDVMYEHSGVKRILSKLAYSRYVFDINSNHTSFGLHERMGENSQAVNFNKVKEISKQARVDASEMWELSKLYLDNSELKQITTQPNKSDAFGSPNFETMGRRW